LLLKPPSFWSLLLSLFEGMFFSSRIKRKILYFNVPFLEMEPLPNSAVSKCISKKLIHALFTLIFDFSIPSNSALNIFISFLAFLSRHSSTVSPSPYASMYA